jgi:prepilin-type N-terminal cleavage/methylation domain-containing protein
MSYKLKQNGFSLAEVLMASAILAVGLLMIAGTFPVAIFLTADSVEQTIAPIVADEAFAKIQLYSNIDVGGKALDLTLLPSVPPLQRDFVRDFNSLSTNTIMQGATVHFSDSTDPAYPSVSAAGNSSPGTYRWAALVRKIVPNNLDSIPPKDTQVQVTVFVCRKTGNGLKYYKDLGGGNINDSGTEPAPIWRTIQPVNGNIITVSTTQSYFSDGCAIVADASGNIYRVLDRFFNTSTNNVELTLDRAWNESSTIIWVVPPPSSGGRSPVIGVYQRIIRF